MRIVIEPNDRLGIGYQIRVLDWVERKHGQITTLDEVMVEPLHDAHAYSMDGAINEAKAIMERYNRENDKSYKIEEVLWASPSTGKLGGNQQVPVHE